MSECDGRREEETNGAEGGINEERKVKMEKRVKQRKR